VESNKPISTKDNKNRQKIKSKTFSMVKLMPKVVWLELPEYTMAEIKI
jgi:hypothetical protein